MVRTLRLLARGEALSKLPFGSNNHGPNTVLWKEINVVYRSNIQQRGRSTAAAAPSGVPDSPKGRKRVTPSERRNMVKDYVNRYREANSGQFPNVTTTVKEVGGSYYNIKKIVQELEYQAKFGLSDSEVATPKRSRPSRKRKSLTESAEVSRKLTVDAGRDVVNPVPDDTLIVKEESEKPVNDHADAQVEIRGAKIEVEKDLIEEDRIASKLKEETEGQKASDDLATEFEIGAEKMEVQKDSTDSHGTKMQEIQQQKPSDDLAAEVKISVEKMEVQKDSTDSRGTEMLEIQQQKPSDDLAAEEIGAEKVEVQKDSMDSRPTKMQEIQQQKPRESEKPIQRTDDSKPPQKTSLWANLKSFADDIISIWRK